MKAVFFDMDDTLYDQVLPFSQACRQMFADQYQGLYEELFAASRRHSDEVFAQAQAGEITMEAMGVYRCRKAFEDFGISVSEKQALEFEQRYKENLKRIFLPDTIEKMLEFCREKEIKTGVISNGAWDHQWQKVRRLGLLRWIPKERIFISGEVGAAKPEPEIFRAVENRLGLGPEALCLAGDSYPNDIFGAKRAGWKAIWLNRRGHRKPEGMPEPDFQVKNEEELFEKVKEISGKGARAECMIS